MINWHVNSCTPNYSPEGIWFRLSSSSNADSPDKSPQSEILTDTLSARSRSTSLSNVIALTKAVTFFVSETFLGYKMRLIRPNTKCHTILESSGQGQAIWPHVGLTCRVILTLYPIIGLRDLDFQLRTNIQVSYHFRIVRTRPSHLTTCGVYI